MEEDKFEKWIKSKIKHETKVYETNMNDPKLKPYTDYEKGLYVGLIRGLTVCLHAYMGIK